MSKSNLLMIGLVSALLLCGGAAAVIAVNDTNNNVADSNMYSSSDADKLFIASSGYEVNNSDLVVKEKYHDTLDKAKSGFTKVTLGNDDMGIYGTQLLELSME